MESDRKDLRVAFDFKLDLMVERLTERKKRKEKVWFPIFKAKFYIITFYKLAKISQGAISHNYSCAKCPIPTF